MKSRTIIVSALGLAALAGAIGAGVVTGALLLIPGALPAQAASVNPVTGTPIPKTGEFEHKDLNLPRMTLEAQFTGPLADTIIQRWKDPGDGTVCYIYMPVMAQHTPPNASGFMDYGSNAIGSISCMPQR